MKKRDENDQLEMLEGAKSIGAGAATIASAGAAIGIGNVFSSLIHSVARNPSLAKQSFGYAILGFALTEAIASFAPMMAFLISSVFRSRLNFHSYNYLFEADSSQCSFYRYCKSQLMFPLNFHYEDVLRQDPLLKLNHANVMEVPGSCEIRVLPKAPYDFIIKNGKLAMEIPRGQKFIQTKRGSTGKSFRSNPFLGSNKDKGYASDLARQSTLRGHGMSNFSVRISTVMSLLDSPVEIRENFIQFSMETEFCEFSPELEDHFEIFEHIRGFNVTIVTSANTQDETLPPWSGFLQKDEGETP